MLLDRTFHPDEANQAFTVGRLLETGRYVYKPTDHHGPTLYYAAAPLQKAFGHNTTASLDGTLLRCTPLVFAILSLVFVFLALRRLLCGRNPVALAAAMLVGTAPMFVFFATDFIQEMLLVCFTTMMLWSGIGYLTPYGRLKPGSWALLFGIAAGLAFATKETSVLTFAAGVLATLPFIRHLHVRRNDAVLAAMGFVLTATLFFSSFGSDFQGVYNAFVAAPLSYLHRAAGDAAAGGANWHVHPWWQYLQWLFLGGTPILHRSPDFGFTIDTGSAFSNMVPLTHLLFLALPAAIFAIRRASRIGRAFLASALYTALLLAFYSVIPYKTPWCTLQILVPFLVTTALGYGTVQETIEHFALSKWQNRTSGHWTTILVFLAALPLCVIATEHIPGLRRINHEPDSPKIPYNYANASPEVRAMAECVEQAVSSVNSSTNAQNFIAVAMPSEDIWPFPWYNRAREGVTGYWTKFDALERLAENNARPSVVIVPMEQGHLVQPLFPYLNRTRRFSIRNRVRARVFWSEQTEDVPAETGTP